MYFEFNDDKQVTRVYNIVAGRWAGAYNPPFTPPFHTHTHWHGALKKCRFIDIFSYSTIRDFERRYRAAFAACWWAGASEVTVQSIGQGQGCDLQANQANQKISSSTYRPTNAEFI